MSTSEKRRSSDQDGNLQDAIDYFTDEYAETRVRGNVALSGALNKLQTEATQNGISGEHITTLLDVACSKKFPDTINKKLMKCLIPQETVPELAALKAVSWMGTNKHSSHFQALLVKWLILVFDCLESTTHLHSIYLMIFHYLADDILCPHICHLLYLLTRKEDVKAFRVRSLIQLQDKMGQQPYIQGLLSVYKLFCPHLVTITIPATRRVFFRPVDRKWASVIQAVQSKRGHLQQEDAASSSSRQPPLSKRQKKELIPEVSMALRLKKSTSVPFTHIKSFKDLLRNMDRLELPGQLAAALRNENLQLVLMCYPDPAIPVRLSYWLHHTLNQEFLLSPVSSDPRCADLLRQLIAFSDVLQEGIPVTERFLFHFLHLWNGDSYRNLILRLITRMRLHSWPTLYEVVLDPLRKLFFCSSVYFKCQIIVCLTDLLRNYCSVEYQRYLYSRRRAAEIANDIAVGHSGDNTITNTDTFSVFPEDVVSFSALETITELVRFVSSLTTLGLTSEKQNALLMHYTLSFFETASLVYLHHEVPVVELPGRGVLYSAFFSTNAMALSRICHIINNYRETVSALRQAAADGNQQLEERGKDSYKRRVKQLNTYILDFCECLWRMKAFQSDGDHSRDSVFRQLDFIPKALHVRRAADLSLTFSFLQHNAMLGYSRSFLDKTQPAGAAVHPSSLRHHKDVFLEYLYQRHVSGIPDFISMNITRKKTARTKPT